MKNKMKLDRRFFMKSVGATAVLGSTLNILPTVAGEEGQSTSIDFDAGYNRVGTNSVKFDMIKMFNPGKQLDVGLGIADMDFRTLPQVTEALKKRLETENWGYELPPLDYKTTIAAWNKRRYGADVPTKNILNSVGVLDGVLSTLMSFGKKDDKVIVSTPAYSAFFSIIHYAGMVEAGKRNEAG